MEKIVKKGDKASPPSKTDQAEALILHVNKKLKDSKSQIDELEIMLDQYIKANQVTQRLVDHAITITEGNQQIIGQIIRLQQQDHEEMQAYFRWKGFDPD